MPELDEARLIEKLRAIEALFARPGSDGERTAAANARERILERLREVAEADPPIEYRFSMGDMWSRRVFLALLRRYDIQPYRRKGQRHTTVMARVSQGFVDETLWPEFEALSSTLSSYLDEVTSRVVADVIHADVSEAAVVDEPKLLPHDVGPEPAAVSTAAAPQGDAPAPEDRQGERDRGKKKKKRKDVSGGMRRTTTRAKHGSPMDDVGRASKVGRNQPCPCGSGKKYKKCCLRTAG